MSDETDALVQEQMQKIAEGREALLTAWIAKTGIGPDQAMLVERRHGGLVHVWVEEQVDRCETHRALVTQLREEAARMRKCLSYALHAFRARISTHPNDLGLARGELACLIGLDEELQHVRMGRLSYVAEEEVRGKLR